MIESRHTRIVSFAILLISGLFIVPISQASPQSTIARDSADQRAPRLTVPQGAVAATTVAQTDAALGASRITLLALAADLGGSEGATVVAPRSRPDQRAESVGLHLPEPGPVSAIIATVALAGFFFLRRTS